MAASGLQVMNGLEKHRKLLVSSKWTVMRSRFSNINQNMTTYKVDKTKEANSFTVKCKQYKKHRETWAPLHPELHKKVLTLPQFI